MNTIRYKLENRIYTKKCTDAEIGDVIEWLARKKGTLKSINGSVPPSGAETTNTYVNVRKS
jgi:hypothetical protein